MLLIYLPSDSAKCGEVNLWRDSRKEFSRLELLSKLLLILLVYILSQLKTYEEWLPGRKSDLVLAATKRK